MMQEGQEQRFLCRFCNKSFCSGNSLGGHMRGHLALISAEKTEENDNGGLGSEREDTRRGMKVSVASKMEPEDDGEASYGLRENPKKSWRISVSKHGASKKLGNLCKECGKGFRSLKALSVHMRSHSVKRREENAACKECGIEFGSMKALFGHMRCHSKRSRVSSESDYEIACPIRKKRSKTRYNKVTPNPSSCYNLNGSSSTAFTETDEVKEVAMCLMMLSMGLRSWDEFNLITGSSNYTNSVNLEAQSLLQSKGNSGNEDGVKFVCDDGEMRKMKKPRENLDSWVSVYKIGNFDSAVGSDDEKKAELEASVDESLGCDKFKESAGIKKGISTELELGNELVTQIGMDQDDLGFEKTNSSKKSKFVDQDFEFKGNSYDDHIQYAPADSEFLKDFERKRKFKCRTCDEVFHSHQALVGHRPTHKTVDSCIELKVEKSCRKSTETSLLFDFEVDSELEKVECNDISLEQEIGKEHECSICFKVFKSGQALGGHKRAHYIRLNESRDEDNMDQELPDYIDNLLDLNFPATLEEESAIDVGLKPWWSGKTLECESPVIFN